MMKIANSISRFLWEKIELGRLAVPVWISLLKRGKGVYYTHLGRVWSIKTHKKALKRRKESKKERASWKKEMKEWRRIRRKARRKK